MKTINMIGKTNQLFTIDIGFFSNSTKRKKSHFNVLLIAR